MGRAGSSFRHPSWENPDAGYAAHGLSSTGKCFRRQVYRLSVNDGKADQHLDYHHGTADIRQIMHWAGKYTEDADIVIEYEPHEKLTHAELLDEMHELRSWVEEGKALS